MQLKHVLEDLKRFLACRNDTGSFTVLFHHLFLAVSVSTSDTGAMISTCLPSALLGKYSMTDRELLVPVHSNGDICITLGDVQFRSILAFISLVISHLMLHFR
jgi:hypothetical protein